MAVISSTTIITSVSLFHLTLAYFFLTDPSAIDEQALVFVLGESMGMPYATGFSSKSPPLAFLAAVLALLGLSDLISLSMPEEASALYYWGTQAPLRFCFSISILFYTYFSGPSSPLFSSANGTGAGFSNGTNGGRGSGSSGPAATDGLKNRVLFTFMFFEMLSWFWIWVTVREERPAVVDRVRKSRKREMQFYQRE